MNNEELIELYEGHIAILECDTGGDSIEIELGGNWVTKMPREEYDFESYKYRVKPEPPCLYGYLHDNGELAEYAFSNKKVAENHAISLGLNVVKFVIAPDEEQPF